METGCIFLAGKRAGFVMRFARCWNERCTSFPLGTEEKTNNEGERWCGFSQRRVSGCRREEDDGGENTDCIKHGCLRV